MKWLRISGVVLSGVAIVLFTRWSWSSGGPSNREFATYRMNPNTNQRSLTIGTKSTSGMEKDYASLADAAHVTYNKDGNEYSFDLLVLEGMESQGWQIIQINDHSAWFARPKR